MKISIKILAVLLLVVTLFACEKEKTDISLERDGTLYEVADQVSFYYPKDFQLNVNNENQKDVRFTKNDELSKILNIVKPHHFVHHIHFLLKMGQ